jgi:hypothetical protein
MHRFSSLEYAPAETRRLLRGRFLRNLGQEPRGQTPEHGGSVLADEAMLHLLQNLDMSFGDEWVHALAVYQTASPVDHNEPRLEDRVAAGWARVVWGRVKVPTGVGIALYRGKARAGAFGSILDERFVEKYRLNPEAQLDGDHLATAERVERGEIEFRNLICRSPKWVAARLWEQTSSSDDGIINLRTWVDKWKVLGAPVFPPSKMWDSEGSERFRKAVFEVIETEKALEGWNRTYERFVKEMAVTSGNEAQIVQSYLPIPPQTLVDRVLWLEDNRVMRSANESLEACEDILALVRLLLADIDEQPLSTAPHPLAAKLFDLANSRPDLLFRLIFSARSHPRLLADLLLHPQTCALACLIIAQWRFNPSAFDREPAQQGNELAKAAAFEDAVSLLVWWLEKERAPPTEVAALLAWLHQVAGAGFIDDLVPQERLRMILRDALLSLSTSSLETIVDALAQERDAVRRIGGRFAAALEIIALGDLSDRINPTPLVAEYIDAVATYDFTLSVHRIDNQSAAALFAIAQRTPDLLEKFFYPINMHQCLTEFDKPDANPYLIADNLSRSLRAHIRILSRAIAGCGAPVSDDLAKALITAVWQGALSHREKGRIAVFAARYETDAIGARLDRRIAIDLAGALTTLSGDQRQQVLDVILETDEPMVLAQLLPFVPREARPAIERRLESLPPAKAGETHSLTEVQARIDELLSAGALGAAEKFIAEETKIQTLGDVPGREVTRLRSTLRLLFARNAWAEIMAVQLPLNVAFRDKDEATDIIEFYKGLTLITQPEDREPERAEKIFRALSKRKPAIAGYAVNAIAAKISTLLREDIFGCLQGAAARDARLVLSEAQNLMIGVAYLTPTDREILLLNQAVLRLALGEPADALALLPPSISAQIEERLPAYRAVALSRIGRRPEAVTVLQAADKILGRTELLVAAWAQIQEGIPFVGSVGISSNDDPVMRVREAYRALHVLDPIQQTAVVSFGDDPFTAFVVEQVRGAAASVISLVPMMEHIKLDGCEDDLTAVIRELLLSRLAFLRWSAPDQSKGGVTPRGNPGERDLMITQGSTILTVIEAVICRKPIRWQTVQNNLRTHFQKLLGYSTCRLFFLMVYVYDQDIQAVIDWLKASAKNDAPPGFDYANLAEIPLKDSRPQGFIARYTDVQGELKVVFLALNLGQENLIAAAMASAPPKS